MQVLCVREYGYIAPITGGITRQEMNAVRVAPDDFRMLKQMLLAGQANESDAPHLFRLSAHAGVEALQVQQYAGVILLPSGNCIEILPKIFIADEAQSLVRSRAVLLKMLRAMPDSPFRILKEAKLACGEAPLLEVFITCFLEEVGKLIRHGICSDYQQEEGNRTFLRGKLLMVYCALIIVYCPLTMVNCAVTMLYHALTMVYCSLTMVYCALTMVWFAQIMVYFALTIFNCALTMVYCAFTMVYCVLKMVNCAITMVYCARTMAYCAITMVYCAHTMFY